MIRREARRRGLVLLLVIACLTLLIVVFALLLRLAWFGRTQVQAQQRRVQADWLAESGLERAAARLATSAGYRGETWDVAAEDMGGLDAGRVRIVVEPLEKPDRCRVSVVAEYPIEPPRRVRRTRQTVMSLHTMLNAPGAEGAR